ncbi:hypothetical protein [Mycobacterium sp. 94-17]|uniref:hypothetical protein n=1 Tax=Mycobacterium sp. 94-17 TaxID=2986147 RepID=UPI002D1F7DC9|nr:hypothetical protein [Mycobacterium sp. 94-17]MEB4208254.1 hypothetical protein [Mycobacterium sp. 94-17]
MADRLDVAARLAEGRAAVESTQTYVRACHALGYQNPDLTTHPAQVREWYAGEDGLDLRALDRDCAELRAAGVLAGEALRMQRAQVAELAAAWTGPGGDAAVQLLQRHCDTAEAVATELRAAAQRCESLRDNLWYLVDSKAVTAVAVDDRVCAQRPPWLAAAAAVLAGDRDGAADIVRQQVIPYVDNDIRTDWLTAMRSTSEGVETSYAMVVDKMTAVPTACFELPGDLGAGVAPVQLAAPVAAAAIPLADPAPTLTAAVPDPASAAPDSVPPPPPPPSPLPPQPVGAPPPADWGGGLGDALDAPTGGLGGGGGLLGLAGRIVEAVGGLIGSAGDGLDGTDPLNDAANAFDDAGDGNDASDSDDTDDAGEKPFRPEDPVGTAVDDQAVDQTAGDPAQADRAQPVEGQPAGPPPPADTPAPGPPAPPADPVSAPAPAADEGKTPCEIAADQVPQVGQ